MNSRSADQSQRDRFEQAARELGVELDELKLREALQKLRYNNTLPADEGESAAKTE